MKQIDIERRMAPYVLKEYFQSMKAIEPRKFNKWLKEHKKEVKDKYGKIEREAAFRCIEICDEFYDYLYKNNIRSKFVIETAVDIFPEIRSVNYMKYGIRAKGDTAIMQNAIKKAVKYAQRLAMVLDIKDDEIELQEPTC